MESEFDVESEFVAFEHPEWSDKPLIGHVVKKSESVTTIQWWIGRYRGPWQACVKIDEEPWLEDLEKSLIIHTFLWDTETTRCRLPKDTIKNIRDAYKNSNFSV